MLPTKTVQRIEHQMAGVFGFFILFTQEFACQAAARLQYSGSATLGGCIERSGLSAVSTGVGLCYYYHPP
jgi:hypothetical protein